MMPEDGVMPEEGEEVEGYTQEELMPEEGEEVEGYTQEELMMYEGVMPEEGVGLMPEEDPAEVGPQQEEDPSFFSSVVEGFQISTAGGLEAVGRQLIDENPRLRKKKEFMANKKKVVEERFEEHWDHRPDRHKARPRQPEEDPQVYWARRWLELVEAGLPERGIPRKFCPCQYHFKNRNCRERNCEFSHDKYFSREPYKDAMENKIWNHGEMKRDMKTHRMRGRNERAAAPGQAAPKRMRR